jgi:hypothetical protein
LKLRLFRDRPEAPSEQVQAVLNDNAPVYRILPAWALLGLVPTMVGIAYLLFYYSETKRLT